MPRKAKRYSGLGIKPAKKAKIVVIDETQNQADDSEHADLLSDDDNVISVVVQPFMPESTDTIHEDAPTRLRSRYTAVVVQWHTITATLIMHH